MFCAELAKQYKTRGKFKANNIFIYKNKEIKIMKKSIAVILAILTIFSLMSCATAFAADGSIVITCVDNYPITIKEVEEAK